MLEPSPCYSLAEKIVPAASLHGPIGGIGWAARRTKEHRRKANDPASGVRGTDEQVADAVAVEVGHRDGISELRASLITLVRPDRGPMDPAGVAGIDQDPA